MISLKHRYLKIFLLSALVFTNIMCEESYTASTVDASEEICRLNIIVKEEWSINQNDNYVKFLINAENTGDLTIQTIEITAGLYFKNDYILKSRFYINDLKLQPTEIIEKYGTMAGSSTDRFFINSVTQNDIERIVYNAPYYSCLSE